MIDAPSGIRGSAFGTVNSTPVTNIVIGAVARDDKADRTGVQAGRVVRIGVAEGNAHELFPFQLHNAPFEFIRDDER